MDLQAGRDPDSERPREDTEKRQKLVIAGHMGPTCLAGKLEDSE